MIDSRHIAPGDPSEPTAELGRSPTPGGHDPRSIPVETARRYIEARPHAEPGTGDTAHGVEHSSVKRLFRFKSGKKRVPKRSQSGEEEYSDWPRLEGPCASLDAAGTEQIESASAGWIQRPALPVLPPSFEVPAELARATIDELLSVIAKQAHIDA